MIVMWHLCFINFSVVVNRVATYKELDSDLFKHAAFATLDDMNLRLLTKRLNLEADIKEVTLKMTEVAETFFCKRT